MPKVEVSNEEVKGSKKTNKTDKTGSGPTYKNKKGGSRENYRLAECVSRVCISPGSNPAIVARLGRVKDLRGVKINSCGAW